MHAIKNVDDVQVEVDDLAHLLMTVHLIFDELDRDKIGRGNVEEIDRIQALIRIAQDKTQRLSEEIATNHLDLRGAE